MKARPVLFYFYNILFIYFTLVSYTLDMCFHNSIPFWCQSAWGITPGSATYLLHTPWLLPLGYFALNLEYFFLPTSLILIIQFSSWPGFFIGLLAILTMVPHPLFLSPVIAHQSSGYEMGEDQTHLAQRSW